MQNQMLRLCLQGTGRLKKGVFFLILLLIGLAVGCTGSRSTRPRIEFYGLNYNPVVSQTLPQLPFILSLQPFQGVPPYDTTRIIYTTNRFSRNRYFYHQWIAEPEEMVTHLLARDIRNAHIVSAVMIPDDPVATHLIKGTVDGFYEQDNKENWEAVLSLTITLIKKNEDDITRKIEFQKNYTQIQVCREKSPEGFADAISIAMAKVSERIIADIYKALAS